MKLSFLCIFGFTAGSNPEYGIDAPVKPCDGQLRVRPSIYDLDDEQWDKFVNAVKQLNSGPRPTKWDQFAKLHTDVYASIHSKASFLAWHRAFLFAMESELRKIDGEVSLPYWDWTYYSQQPENDPVFQGRRLGLDGKDNPGGCVVNGSFADFKVYFDGTTKEPKDHCFKREFARQGNKMEAWLSPDLISRSILRSANFKDVWNNIEHGPHGVIHNTIGADFSGKASPSDPIFYIHHAFVDKLWFDWAQRKEGRESEYFTDESISFDSPIVGFDYNLTDMIDNEKYLCYTYPEDHFERKLDGAILPFKSGSTIPDPIPTDFKDKSTEASKKDPEPKDNLTPERDPEPENNSTSERDPEPENNSTSERDPEPENNSTPERDPEPENNSTPERDPEPEDNSTPEKGNISTTEPIKEELMPDDNKKNGGSPSSSDTQNEAGGVPSGFSDRPAGSALVDIPQSVGSSGDVHSIGAVKNFDSSRKRKPLALSGVLSDNHQQANYINNNGPGKKKIPLALSQGSAIPDQSSLTRFITPKEKKPLSIQAPSNSVAQRGSQGPGTSNPLDKHLTKPGALTRSGASTPAPVAVDTEDDEDDDDDPESYSDLINEAEEAGSNMSLDVSDVNDNGKEFRPISNMLGRMAKRGGNLMDVAKRMFLGRRKYDVGTTPPSSVSSGATNADPVAPRPIPYREVDCDLPSEQAKYDYEFVMAGVKAPPVTDRSDLKHLRVPTPLPVEFLKKMGSPVSLVRAIERNFAKVVDELNRDPNFVSTAALINRNNFPKLPPPTKRKKLHRCRPRRHKLRY